jgi:hypothetical protein
MKKEHNATIIMALATLLTLIGCASGNGHPATVGTQPNLNATVANTTPGAANTAQDNQDMPVRGEINQSYQLSPGAQVDISGVEGMVEVETVDGSTAQISLVRMARTQKDYDCDKIDIQHTADKLVLSHHQDKQCGIIHAREQLKLTVPRSANLTFSQIEGDLSIGPTDGALRLANIEGFVKVAQAPSAEVKSLEKGLSLNVSQPGAQGISISQVEGSVELGLVGEINADLRITGNTGEIDANIPGAVVNNSGQKGYRARIGTGGVNITLSQIEGNIKIHRV